MKRVGIIGAGPAGLCALRHAKITSGMDPIVWEHAAEVGGAWVYTPSVGRDKYGYPIHGSMYESMRTNLPKESMAFPDFPFKDGPSSFVHHSVVLQYFKDYADHFGLKKFIKFEHHVDMIEPVQEGDRNTPWRVRVRNLRDDTFSTTICEFIIVCNGHYTIPKIPNIDSIDKFRGILLHSHDFRKSEQLQSLRVAVLGAGISGLDISLEISPVATEVYLCHDRPPVQSELPENVIQKPGIKQAKENGFILLDDSFIEADGLILCTGYDYFFPFLSPSTQIRVEDQYVTPLYKQMINAIYPTMGLIAIPSVVYGFLAIDIQIRFFIKFCTGSKPVPDKKMMEHEIKQMVKAKQANGIHRRHFHKLDDLIWTYLDDLIDVGNLDTYAQVVKAISEDCGYNFKYKLMTFKKINYKLLDSSHYISSISPVTS